MEYIPIDLRRASVTLTIEGAVNEKVSFVRSREGARHDFCGPDLFGNGYAYGRALYTSQHFKGEAKKIRGRDFIIDDKYTMSCAWHISRSDVPSEMMFGVLSFEEEDDVLVAQYS